MERTLSNNIVSVWNFPHLTTLWVTEEHVLVLSKYTMRYLGVKGQVSAIYSQTIQCVCMCMNE